MQFATKPTFQQAKLTTTTTTSMETLTVSPFVFPMKPTHTPYTPPHIAVPTRSSLLDFGTPTQSATKMTIHNAARSELLCRYPSKLCDNLRSEKRGGGLHRFCAIHRERANINQRRVDHRRRLRRRGGVVSPTDKPRHHHEPHSSDEEDAHASEDMLSLDMNAFGLDDMSIPLCSALSEDDLQMLIALLDEPCESSFSLKHEPASEFS